MPWILGVGRWASTSLDDDSLTGADINLPDRRGELERIVNAHALRMRGRARVIADDFLQERLRQRQAGHVRALEEERADAILRPQRAGDVDGHLSADQAPEVERAAALLLLRDGVEIDSRLAGDLAVADHRDARVGDARGEQRFGAVREPRVQLALAYLRFLRSRLLDGVALNDDLRDLSREHIGLLLRDRRSLNRRQGENDAENRGGSSGHAVHSGLAF